MLGIYNSTAFGKVLSRELTAFQRLYHKKAMLHHYTDYANESVVSEAEYSAGCIIADYQEMERQSGMLNHNNKASNSKIPLFSAF